MAIAPFLWKLQWGGPLYTTESWSCGMHWHGDIDVVLAEALLPALTFWMNSMNDSGSVWNYNARLGFIKFNAIDPVTGKQSASGPTNAHYPSPALVATGAGHGMHAPQLATCVTLRTNLTRGRGHAGRMFLPAAGLMDDSGQLGVSNANQINDSTRTLIAQLQAVLPGKAPVVYSKIGQLVQPIIGVQTGRVVDTQRRRRTSLDEDYTPINLL